MYKNLWVGLALLATTSLGLQAQVVGGRNVYDFLSLSYSARTTALGGNLITVQDDDVALAYQNPAALNASMHNQMSVQQSVYVAGITYGLATYAHHLSKVPLTIQGGIQYVNYGKFERAQINGDRSPNSFSAAEYAIGGGVGYQASERLSVGANLKTVLSYLEGYNSVGFSSDWAATYQDTAHSLTVSFVLSNLGSQFTTHAKNGNFQRLPFDAQLGVSHRLKYLPLRFSVIGHHLHRWNILYDDPALEESSGILGANPTPKPKATVGEITDNVFRHLIFNLELLMGKKEAFRLRVGYNRMRQGELNVKGLRTMAGFSAGLGLKVYKFRVDYGFSAHHIAGTMHHFGISTNLSDF